MNITNIIETFFSNKLLTTANVQTLKTQASSKDFFEKLVSIYEDNLTNYLLRCESVVIKYLKAKELYPEEHIHAIAIQHIVNWSYGVMLDIDKASLLISLIILLKQIKPDLAVSLGMSTVSGTNLETATNIIYPYKACVIKVFINYLARYRLFEEFLSKGLEKDLKELCDSIQIEAPNIFPEYLLNSFIKQKQISNTISSMISNKEPDNANGIDLWSQGLADVISGNANFFYQCLYGLVFYVSHVLRTSDIQLEMEHFSHLSNDVDLKKFVSAICTGYIESMSSVEKQKEVYSTNVMVINSDIKNFCMPALCIIGINMSTNLDDVVAAKTTLKQALITIESEKIAIEEEVSKKIVENDKKMKECLTQYNSNKHAIGQLAIDLKQKVIQDIENACSQVKKTNIDNIDKQLDTIRQEALKNIDEWRANFKPNISISTQTGPIKFNGPL